VKAPFIHILAFLSLFVYPLLGQGELASKRDTILKIEPLSLGVHGSSGINLHTASFSGFRGIPSCCPEYTSATALGGSLGLLGKYALTPNYSFGIRLAFNGLSGDFSSSEEQYVLSQQGIATITHTLETSHGIMSIEPEAIFSFGSLNLSAGAWFGIPLSMQFAQRETVFPGTFDGFNRIRNELSGEIPATPSFLIGAAGGVSYELPLNMLNTIRLAPELRAFTILSELSEATSWNVFGIRAGLSLLWSPHELQLPPPIPPPPIVIPLPDLLSTLHVSKEGDTASLDSISLIERVNRVVQPILPYVFFDDASSEIPERYQLLDTMQASFFSEQSLMNADVLDRYYHVMNLAGFRLKNNPGLIITITGTTSGGGQERRNIVLARKRAENVAKYLQVTWKIDPKRIVMQAKSIPDNPSNSSYPEGLAENRRVELAFSDPSMFEVLTIMDSTLSIEPEVFSVKGRVISGTMVDRWRLSIMNDTNYLEEKMGLHDLYISRTWKPLPKKIGRKKDTVRFRYNVIDTAGRTHTSHMIMPVKYQRILNDRTIGKVGDDKVKRYSLILFDFDASTLNERNMRVIKEIQSTKGIVISSILGATDMFGDAKRNAELSLERAKAVGVLLNADPSIIRGDSAYEGTSNALPEGRFYNRTVIIEAKEIGEH
jgi:outer membrane protein OmpA-like peptidoglycan-associated protein